MKKIFIIAVMLLLLSGIAAAKKVHVKVNTGSNGPFDATVKWKIDGNSITCDEDSTTYSINPNTDIDLYCTSGDIQGSSFSGTIEFQPTAPLADGVCNAPISFDYGKWTCPASPGSQKDVPCAVWDFPLFDILDCNNDVIEVCNGDLMVSIDEYVFDNSTIKEKALNNSEYDDAVDEIFSELKAFYPAPDTGCGDCEGGKRLCSGGILCDDKKPSGLLSGTAECGNCADWSNVFLSLLRTIGVPKDRVYVVSFQNTQGSHAVAVYESDGGEWRVLDLLNLNDVKSIDSWRYIPGFCKCTQYYTNDYSSNKFDDKALFNNFCTDDQGKIDGVPAATATQLCDPTPDPCDPSGDPVGTVALSFSAEDVVVT